MSYRVVLDGKDIMDMITPSKTLVSPGLTAELNASGSLEFTMPPSHEAYNDVRPLISTVEVYEDRELIWFGRPVEIKKDFYTQKQVYCEGALAFFNDSVQRLREYNSIKLHTFFRTVISNHNQQVAADRKFTVGRITIPDKTVYRKLNYDSTIDTLKRQCLNAEGGYFFLRRVNGVNYIDWLEDMPYDCNQPCEFGLNLTELISQFDGSSIATCVLPLGEEDSVTGLPLTVKAINKGSDVIESAAASEYGRITKAVSFNGVRYASTLYKDGIEYLQETQFSNLSIECSASELHLQNENYEQFRIGQKVRCHSIPHLLDCCFPLIKMSVQLDTAAKQITLGSVKKPTLTEIEKETRNNVETISTEILGTDPANLNTIGTEEVLTLEERISALENPSIEGRLDTISTEELLSAVADRINSDSSVLEQLEATFPEQDFTYPVTSDQLEAVIPEEVMNQIADNVSDANDRIEAFNETAQEINDSIVPLTDEEKADLEQRLNDIAPYLSDLESALTDLLTGADDGTGVNSALDGLNNDLNTLQDSAESASSSQTIDKWRHEINGVALVSGTINFVTS